MPCVHTYNIQLHFITLFLKFTNLTLINIVMVEESFINMVNTLNTAEECDWDCCPTELLLLVFEYLDEKTLLKCMAVNKRWYSLVLSIFKLKGNWQEVVRLAFADQGASFRKKSLLSWQEIIINYCLWQNIQKAHAIHSHSFEVSLISNIHVYKGNLIVASYNGAVYHDITNYDRRKSVPCSCVDFDENDYMVSALEDGDYNNMRILSLSPKQDPDSHWNDTRQAFTVPVYKIYNDCCYVSTNDRCLFMLKWTNEIWDWKLLAKHYGNGLIVDLNVYQGEVYAMLNWGQLLRVDLLGLKLVPCFSFDIPKYSHPLLYQRSGAIISVPLDSPSNFKRQDSEHWVFECPGLTCHLEHGDILILGFGDGKVEIYQPQNMTTTDNPEPTLSINIQDFTDRCLYEPAIMSLEVREARGSHDLFIATRETLDQIHLVYPESMQRFMLDCK